MIYLVVGEWELLQDAIFVLMPGIGERKYEPADDTVDPATGRRNVGCRRLSLRNRTECGTNVTAPSDLKRIYTDCVGRGEKLPIPFTVGAHPLDFVAATMRQGDYELALIA